MEMPMRTEPIETNVVHIRADAATLEADLSVPKNPAALVVFCHGSGSSRFSRRNRAVADVLIEGGLATLMLDLLTPEEEAVDRETREHRFNIELLGRRVIAATDWTRQ